MARMLDGMERLLRREVAPPPPATLIGMRLASFAVGTVQGGILAALADAAMGWAYMTTLGEGESYTTLEMKVNFLRPARSGPLRARARVLSAGRTIGLVECAVLGDGDKLVAHGVSTCLTLRGEQAAGR
jgi:uncharacterized protein (TIGR00369 family)